MTNYNQAEELRKNRNYAEAEPLFATIWEASDFQDTNAGWRYVFCLRKQGKLAEALKIARQAREHGPDDRMLRSELVWTLYDAQIKPAQKAEDLSELLTAASEAIDAGAEDLALMRIAFAVAAVAKAKGKWQLVAEWCDKLDYRSLKTDVGSDKSGQSEARMSDREQWFYKRIKAAIELGDWDTTEQLAADAVETFPRNRHFRRWHATAQAECGNLTAAVAELAALCQSGRPDWFEWHDLARYEARSGIYDDALVHAAQGALIKGEDKVKVNLYQLMGHIWMTTGELVNAARMLSLYRQVYEHNGWRVNEKQEKLEAIMARKIDEAGQAWLDIPHDTRQLVRELRPVWQDLADSKLDFRTGTVKMVNDERKFGFIQPDDGSPDVHFKFNDAPRNIARDQRVRFVVTERIDPKDQQVKPSAINIRVEH
jgi:cold shock CspA family protein